MWLGCGAPRGSPQSCRLCPRSLKAGLGSLAAPSEIMRHTALFRHGQGKPDRRGLLQPPSLITL